ncbi:MAG TPA: MFS transporter [Candidatus Binatia bacterium]|nr:MFS transporter [Candidatus Binatia bacterium]
MPTTVRRERLNLWVISAAQFLTLAGMTAILPLLPLYLAQIGVSDRNAVKYWTGALGSAPFAVAVFATPIWGSLSDRFGYKPMVVRSVAGIAIATVGMGLASSPVELLVWRGVQGAVSGVFPAAVALVSALTPAERVGRALAILQSARAAGGLCGPLLGGLVADLIGIHALFYWVGGIAAATTVLCALVLDRDPEEPPAAHAAAAGSLWRSLLGDGGTLGMLALIVLFQVTLMTSWPTLALFVQKFDVPESRVATTTGLLIFASGFPALVTATVWARLGARRGLVAMIALSLACTGTANVCIGLLAESIPAVLALRAFAGLSLAGFIPLSFEWLAQRAPAGARGRMAGLASTAMMVGNVIGPALGGWLAVRVGLASTFYAPGAMLAAVGVGLAALSLGADR